MKIKTSELTGAAFDWAVAKCEGKEAARVQGLGGAVRLFRSVGYDPTPWQPTINWAQGGPIIEREGITVSQEGYWWSAYFRNNLFEDDGSEHWQTGPTPLIAAMRCYVASKLGDEVDVPDELFKENDHA